jgi:L-2,4-diaminobutyrate decarboxylase
MNNKIPEPFSPSFLREEGHKLVDILADYLENALSGKEEKVLPWAEPDLLAEKYSEANGWFDSESFSEYMRRVIADSHHLHHPHYVGHQVTTPLPLTALVHLATALLNNGAAIYEMGPVAMAMERNLVKYFAKLTGIGDDADGIFTHGGSAGNLTAMLAARQNKCSYNIWEDGVREMEKPGYIVSDQSHYGIARNLKIMGLGDAAAVRLGYDSKYRMKTGELEAALLKAKEKGIRVISVVANACSTATGSYDNLREAGEFCKKHKLWLHVDGAHGLGVLFSEKRKHLTEGLEMADSIVIDFHKMLLVGGLNTLVLFRDKQASFETFSQKASYLFRQNIDNEWYNSAKRTLECTKSALGVVAYTAVKYYGNSYYANYIDSRYDLAQVFSELIEKSADFELAVKPEANIVCFRYRPSGLTEEDANTLNTSVRDAIIKEGDYFLVQTELGGKMWLRTTLINPVTSIDDLTGLLNKIREAALQLRKLPAI